jgi:hypothetical protein
MVLNHADLSFRIARHSGKIEGQEANADSLGAWLVPTGEGPYDTRRVARKFTTIGEAA